MPKGLWRPGWSDAARASSLAVRRAKAKGRYTSKPKRMSRASGIPIPVPMGKKVIGYHRAPFKENIKGIQAKGFQTRDNSKQVWFSNQKRGQNQSYGPYVIAVKVPRKAIIATNQKSSREVYFAVQKSYMQKLHTRVQTNKRRRAAGKPPITRKIKVIQQPVTRWSSMGQKLTSNYRITKS